STRVSYALDHGEGVMRRKRVLLGLGALVLTLGTVIGISMASALANDVQHGIGFTKGCSSPTAILQPYSCSYSIRNSVDDAHDTLTISSLIDTVQASIPTTSGNIVRQGQLTTIDALNVQTGSVCFGFVRGGTDLSATHASTTVTSATAAFASPA